MKGRSTQTLVFLLFGYENFRNLIFGPSFRQPARKASSGWQVGESLGQKLNSGSFHNQKAKKHESRKSPIPYYKHLYSYCVAASTKLNTGKRLHRSAVTCYDNKSSSLILTYNIRKLNTENPS